MSAIEESVAALRDHGSGTLAEVAARLPHLTPRQVGKALQNASLRGECHFITEGRIARGPNGLWHYGAADGTLPEQPWDAEAPRGQFGIGRVSSVWEWAGQ